jgi:hypothetical protein
MHSALLDEYFEAVVGAGSPRAKNRFKFCGRMGHKVVLVNTGKLAASTVIFLLKLKFS